MKLFIPILRHIIIVFILLLPQYYTHASQQLDVLAIHSYHQDYPWTFSQYEAFKKQLKINLPEYTINFSTEYLDTKRINPSKNYRHDFLHYLNSKHDTHLPNLIYVTDDNALNFLNVNKRMLKWKTPIIFSGVNNTKFKKTEVSRLISGVFEYKDIHSSIALAKSLTKKGGNIIFLGDGGTTDKAIKKEIANDKFINDSYKIINLSYSNIDLMLNKLSTINNPTIIITSIGRIRNKKNVLLSIETTINAITRTGNKVLIMEDTYLFHGVLGGYVTSGRIQGESAANIASEIIHGKNKPEHKVYKSTEYILSWPEIKKFKLSKNTEILSNATIINFPPSLLQQYPQITKWLLWFASVLIIIIIGFILNTRRKNIQLIKQYTDTVTGLPNRIKLLNDIYKFPHPCLVIIDVNNFKSINNIYGLNVGDDLLCQLSKRIQRYVFNKKSVYRVGGNQFAILNEISSSNQEPEKYIKRLLKDIRNHSYRIGNIDINLTLTAGLSRNEHEFLIPRAEQALQEAKKNNKNFALIENTKNDTEQHRKNILWAQKLNFALTENRIIPYFQSITNNKTGKIDKVESLVRLIDKDNNAILPAFFLDAARSTRQYTSLTKVMIDKTFQSVVDLDISISINLSVEDIRDDKTIKYFKAKLDEYNVAEKVIVELTETEGIENYAEVSEFIHDIKKLGCRVAVDDFGTGYSNFTHLIHLNVDYLKIDGSIIQNILKDKNAEIVAKTLVDFAEQLNIETIAEYVDSKEILNKVTEIGINYSQGNFLSKPQPDILH